VNVSTNGKSLQRVSLSGYANDPTNWFGANPTLVVSATGDSDGDGIPDVWENLYGLNAGDPSDAAQDFDGDGMTNLQEYLAGTNPLIASSTLAIAVSLTPAVSARLQFNAVSNVTYAVEYRTSLSTGTWLNLQSITSAPSDRIITLTNVPGSASRFYRVTVP
jgi:hypothetical protein